MNGRIDGLVSGQRSLAGQCQQIKERIRAVEKEASFAATARNMELESLENRLLGWMACGVCLALGGCLFASRKVRKGKFYVAACSTSVPGLPPVPICPQISRMDEISSIDAVLERLKLDPHDLKLSMTIPDMLSERDWLIEQACQDAGIVLKPSATSDVFKASFCSTAGNTRPDNQDYVIILSIGNGKYIVFIFADGCGGSDGGAFASYLAVRGAALSLIRALGRGDVDGIEAATQALADASLLLEEAGRKLPELAKIGMRTTLSVIIQDEDRKRYCFAYVGDGGGVVVRRNNKAEKFLFADKADVGDDNTVASSLGAVREGDVVYGSLRQYEGDLLLCGCDGVFDYVGEKFPQAVAYSLARNNGDVDVTCREVVTQLSQKKTDAGAYLCRDNLTLLMAADRARRGSRASTITPVISQPSTQDSGKKETADVHADERGGCGGK